MCFSLGVTVAMVGAGAVATGVTLCRREAAVIPATLAYFTLMEAIQVAGYARIDQCGDPVNQTATMLAMLHIVFQPFVINAFAMETVGRRVGPRMRALVWGLCGLSSTIMLLQLYPFDWAGTCVPGSNLCGPALCTVTGDWHQAWDVPFNGLMVSIDAALGFGWGFPTYILAGLVLPLAYGAWRFAVFHAIFGPILAGQLTGNPNEVPAIWCLFAIGITLIALSPAIRRRMAVPARTAPG